MGDSLREEFERDGYVVFDPGIPAETLSDAVTDLEGEFKPPASPQADAGSASERAAGALLAVRPFSYRDAGRIQDAWKASAAVKEIARAPAVLDLLREFYGREPLPFQTLNFRVGTQQAPHADAFHFNSDPPGFMCGVWVALEDIDEASGPLVYFPGSHRLPEVTTADVPMAPTRGGGREVRELHRRADLTQRLRTARGSPQEGSGVALVVQSPPRRLADAGPPEHPQEPGDALLLRGLPLLDADVVSARQDAHARPEVHHLGLSRLSFDDPVGLSPFAGSASVSARNRAGGLGRGRPGSDRGPCRPRSGRPRRRPGSGRRLCPCRSGRGRLWP